MATLLMISTGLSLETQQVGSAPHANVEGGRLYAVSTGDVHVAGGGSLSRSAAVSAGRAPHANVEGGRAADAAGPLPP